jgi:hypothetical protein
MIAVIQCAASKQSNAGHLKTSDGKRVVFVAHPEIAPVDAEHLYARPDGPTDSGKSWRDVLLEYNAASLNPLALLPAYRLYENKIYYRLVEKLGCDRVYILSAGWGLIKSDFLTPYYNITLSSSVRGPEAYKRRRKADVYGDFNMLSVDIDDEIMFFGGKDYVQLFCTLTSKVRATRKIFHSALEPPDAPGCVTFRFNTTTRTNWHYECADAFLRSV